VEKGVQGNFGGGGDQKIDLSRAPKQGAIRNIRRGGEEKVLKV